MLAEKDIKEIITYELSANDFNDSPLDEYCAWNKQKAADFIKQLTMQAFANKACYSNVDVNAFIHMAVRLYFLGVGGGQIVGWRCK